MGLFGGKKKAAADKADGSTFLAEARRELTKVYDSYAPLVDNAYETVEDFLSDLEADVWKIVERIAKESYRNGVRRGQAKRADA
jgi:hypothetical protein